MNAAALPPADEPPVPIDREAWRRFPLAKRRLILLGPDSGSRVAPYETFTVMAGEACCQALTAADARVLCESIPFPHGPVAKVARTRRELPRIVRGAYNPPDGQPLLTGCPRDPAHSGNPHTSRLRERFAPFCDDDCARSCLILRAATQAGAVLRDGPFAAVYLSSLWAEGAKLGLGLRGRAVYERLAIRALADPSYTVPASQRYLAAKLSDLVAPRTVSEKLRRFERLGLATLRDRRTGLREVHALSEKQVRELEENYGTLARVEQRRAARRAESEEYAEWLAEEPMRRANWTLARTRGRAARLSRPLPNLPKKRLSGGTGGTGSRTKPAGASDRAAT